MALKDIERSLDWVYANVKPSTLRGRTHSLMHEIYVNYENMGIKTAQAINEAFQHTYNTTVTHVSAPDLIQFATEVGNEWLQKVPPDALGNLINVTAEREPGLDGVVIVGFGKTIAGSSDVSLINWTFRRELFQKYQVANSGAFNWDDKVKRPELDKSGIETGNIVESTMGEYVGDRTAFSHDEGTNVAKSTFIEFLEGVGARHVGMGGTHQMRVTDIAMEVWGNLGIFWKQENKKVNGRWRRVWVIKGELAGFNPPYKAGIDLGKDWTNRILGSINDLANDQSFIDRFGPKATASVPLLHTIADAELKRVADLILEKAGFTKGGQKVKVINRPKAPEKLKNRKGIRKNTKAKSTRKKTLVKVPIKKLKSSAGKETGKGGQLSTSTAAELARQRKYIQSRLPAQVRRNMGRPALINQEGTFSESVKLKSLHQAARTVVAKYTYQLYPYATFENKGKRRWPLGYNPKALIAKSIRELATGRIQQKLTVRRV